MSFANNFMWIPSDYVEAAVIAREAASEMLARLEWMTLKPQVILDVGCGTGELSAQLQTRYPTARVIALDSSLDMLACAQQHMPLSINADAEKSPFANQSVDMIVANFFLPWQANLSQQLREWRRVLRPDGLLMFTALGPDTLREYRDELGMEHLPLQIDMHDIGDVLLQEGFADPVMDVSYFTTSYREKNQLLRELRMSGMLTGGNNVELAPTAAGKWDVTYEVVFAHAFAPPARHEYSANNDGVTRIPISSLRRRQA